MNRLFAFNTAISATIHVLIVVALLVFSFFSCRARRPPREIVTFIDLQVLPAVEELAVPREAPPAPPEPAAPPKPRKIEVSRRVVQRDDPAPSQDLTREKLREMLASGERAERPDARADAFTEYLAYVQLMMHNAWQQPTALSGASGLVAGARVRVRRDGSIVRREIIRSSGNEMMDASVMAALESVAQLRPLPPGRGEFEDITINFELTLP